jgi:glycerate kinase
MLIPTAPLVVCASFGEDLSAQSAAAAIARGLRAGGVPAPDICVLDGTDAGEVRPMLDALDFNRRMHRARAVILGAERLCEQALEGSAAFEIATRARQSGVPAYAVTAANLLDPFDARILDLQVILQAHDERGLAGAGRKLAALL